MPLEVDVDNDVIELVADDNPVDVDVDSEARLPDDARPVDNDAIELFADDRPVEVDVDNVLIA
ncbi:gene 11-1 protein [Burkholderia pseudomallei]|nr:gene 11-1 protein [Burkholderia pseudomallei]